VVEAARRFPTLVLKGAYMEGRLLTAEEAQSLAALESREVMLSKVAGLMKNEMTRAASMFQALQARFLQVLEAFKEKLAPEEPSAVVDAPIGPSPDSESGVATAGPDADDTGEREE